MTPIVSTREWDASYSQTIARYSKLYAQTQLREDSPSNTPWLSSKLALYRLVTCLTRPWEAPALDSSRSDRARSPDQSGQSLDPPHYHIWHSYPVYACSRAVLSYANLDSMRLTLHNIVHNREQALNTCHAVIQQYWHCVMDISDKKCAHLMSSVMDTHIKSCS